MSGPTQDDLDRLDDALRKLRMEYDKYFAGIERLEPSKSRDEIKRTFRRMISEQGNNTARKFRLQSLQATFVTYEAHWNRITRQIEEGTFKRDRMRAQAILGESDSPAAASSAPGATAAGDKAGRAKGDGDGFPEHIRKLHEAFEQARLTSGSDIKPISLASLAATVQKQTAAITAQYKCTSVEFKVALKDGKPILKAVPR